MTVELFAALFAFIAVTVGVVAVVGRSPVSRVTEQRLEGWRRPPPRRDSLDAAHVLRRGTSSLPAFRSLLAEGAWSQRAAKELQQAGLRLKVSEYLLLRMVTSAAAGLLVLLVTQGGLIGFLLTFVFAGVGFMLPAFYVSARRRTRSEAITRQLVEALQLISNALRSGFAFGQAIEMASKQMTPPIQDEFAQFLRDVGLGVSADDALRDMAARSGSYDLDMAVTAILVQRTTGGNLSEVLDNVTETMRERERIRGEIRGLTAHQRLTGLILSAWPVILALLFFALNPSLMSVLWTDALGRVVLAIGATLQLVGFFAIRRILDIDI